MASLKKREYTSQMINPPIILTLSGNEELMLKKYMEHFTAVGFEIEHFGGKGICGAGRSGQSVLYCQEGTTDGDDRRPDRRRRSGNAGHN